MDTGRRIKSESKEKHFNFQRERGGREQEAEIKGKKGVELGRC